ncbi:carboxylesterase/lipase family protein [Actinophytocola gossypii]|uniref:Carboxylic ester hydrolase n=1 Tax=Actinophytocola gossypii TaxID=2812003 RepID=A0ABT2J3C9_9PSEU|nr:carboxylesterase family protein [Actinophytocola gossypii]MCT2582353.1 carboxylesterase family protein [Actinophytocola gossypii]
MNGWQRCAAVVAVVFGLVGGVPASAGTDPSLARTETGLVRGTVDGDAVVFRGIPYAAPPVGALRWRDPAPAQRWRGVRDATRPAPACAQHRGELPEESRSEDCLYLNVTAPAGQDRRPVVVWLHGGGFYMGAGGSYDATRLAARGDVVVVTVNYRLGVFGFFGHPELKGSGTFGLRDQQAALGWVRRNIGAFGGDPGNVTVAGQSAGGISACAHLTSPSAAGLFDRAIMQSGSCDLSWLDNFEYRGERAASIFPPVGGVEEQGRRVAADLGCGDPTTALACLRGLSVDALMPVQRKFIKPAYGTPVLPLHPADAVRRGWFHRVPVLAGNTRNEATSSTSIYDGGQAMSERTYDAVLAATFGDDEAAVRAEYPRSDYDSAALAWSAIVTDRKWACSQYATSRKLARHTRVFQYEYADPQAPPLSPLPPTMPMGAQHASDLWSLFDLGGMAPPFTAGQQRLSDRIIEDWTTFAETGRIPGWPEFDTGYTRSLAPGDIRPVDLAAEHHCGFWN